MSIILSLAVPCSESGPRRRQVGPARISGKDEVRIYGTRTALFLSLKEGQFRARQNPPCITPAHTRVLPGGESTTASDRGAFTTGGAAVRVGDARAGRPARMGGPPQAATA